MAHLTSLKIVQMRRFESILFQSAYAIISQTNIDKVTINFAAKYEVMYGLSIGIFT